MVEKVVKEGAYGIGERVATAVVAVLACFIGGAISATVAILCIGLVKWTLGLVF